MAVSQARVCEFDERSVSGGSAGRLRGVRLTRDGHGELAYVSGADEKVGETAAVALGAVTVCGGAGKHLVGRQRRGSKHGLPRVDHLRQAPAKVRFLSIEPLLEDLGEIDQSGITWVIVGGESGPGARPMKREWVVSIRKQCRMQGVPFFFKQWGGARKAKNGRLLDGRTYDEYPERVLRPIPERADCLAWAEEFGKSFQISALAVG